MMKMKCELRAKNTQIEQLEKWTDSINNPTKIETSNSSNKKIIPVPILGKNVINGEVNDSEKCILSFF